MLDGLACIVRLGVSLSKELVSLDLLLLVSSLLAKFEELLSVLNCAIQLTLCLVNHTNLLVALSLNVLVLGTLRHIETLLEELKGHVEVVHLQVFVGNQLVHTYQVNRDNSGGFDKFTCACFVESRF